MSELTDHEVSVAFPDFMGDIVLKMAEQVDLMHEAGIEDYLGTLIKIPPGERDEFNRWFVKHVSEVAGGVYADDPKKDQFKGLLDSIVEKKAEILYADMCSFIMTMWTEAFLLGWFGRETRHG